MRENTNIKEVNKKEKPVYVETTLLHEVVRLAWKIVIIIVVFFLIFTFIYGVIRCEDDSMSPSIKSGDLAINYKLEKRYVASDVVAIKYEDDKQVRRVVAVEGDTVDIAKDGLIINGALQQEDDIYTTTNQYKGGVSFPLTIGSGEVFVLADNREDTIDSRIYGPVSIEDTYGKVILIIKKHNI